jgi:hypothetical protein
MKLERAVHAFESRVFKEPGDFNASYKALLTEYLDSMNTFDSDKWNTFHGACDFIRERRVSRYGGPLTMKISQTDMGRRNLNFSSPIRE